MPSGVEVMWQEVEGSEWLLMLKLVCVYEESVMVGSSRRYWMKGYHARLNVNSICVLDFNFATLAPQTTPNRPKPHPISLDIYRCLEIEFRRERHDSKKRRIEWMKIRVDFMWFYFDLLKKILKWKFV